MGAGRQRRSGRGKSRAWSMVGLGDRKGGAHGTHDWKVGVGTVKNPKLQNPESWVRAKADAYITFLLVERYNGEK